MDLILAALSRLADAEDDALYGRVGADEVAACAATVARLARPPEGLAPALAGEVAAALQRAGWLDEGLITALHRRSQAAPTWRGSALALATDPEARGHLLRVRVVLVPGGAGVSTAQRWSGCVSEAVEAGIRAGLGAQERHHHVRWEIVAESGRRVATLEGASVGLAAAVAARAALVRREAPGWAFTGAVGLDGAISAVGALPVKLRLAAQQRVEAVVFPARNLPLPDDLRARAEGEGVALRPVLRLSGVWRALGWAEAEVRARRLRRITWLAAAGAVGLGAVALRERTLEICLDPPHPGPGQVLTATARADRAGQALVFLLGEGGRATLVGAAPGPAAVGPEPAPLLTTPGAWGARAMVDDGDALVVVWSPDALPAPGEALRLVRAPLDGAGVQVVPLARAGACWSGRLVGAGEVGLYRMNLGGKP